MNKKGQAFQEFLITWGWAVLVVLAVIGALLYFVVLPQKVIAPENNQTYQEKVCSNLDRNQSVYKGIQSSMLVVEQTAKMKVVDIWGNTSKPRMWNADGVMCEMKIEMCQPQYVFCMDAKMVVPVNYTEYEAWYNADKTI